MEEEGDESTAAHASCRVTTSRKGREDSQNTGDVLSTVAQYGSV
jgi:hypothetical protein